MTLAAGILLLGAHFLVRFLFGQRAPGGKSKYSVPPEDLVPGPWRGRLGRFETPIVMFSELATLAGAAYFLWASWK